MTKNKALAIGLITVWPFIYMFIFIFTMFSMASNMGGGDFGYVFKIHIATMFQLYCMTAGYIYYIVKTNTVPKNKKTLWAVIVFLGNMISMPIFWYLYIWKPLKNNNPEDKIPNIFPWVLVSNIILIVGVMFIKSPFAEFETNDIYNLAIRDNGIELQNLLQNEPSLANSVRERDNWTPLHGAACNGNIDTVRVLLNANANVNIANINRNTPLHCAAQDNHLEIAKLLLEAGADPNVIGRKSKTPLDWAIWNEHSEMANLLKQYGAKLSTDK